MSIFKKKTNPYGEYPCVDYLNNALRSLLNDEHPNTFAISEICYCILKADGKFHGDVAHELAMKGLCPFENEVTE
jgi:hypothetical protein